MKRIYSYIVSILILTSIAVPMVGGSGDLGEELETNPVTGSNYVPHDPIRINSNADFDVAHGVSDGNGAEGNPWIIENWDINGTGYGYCIYIGNTTDHFEVRDCYLHEANGVISIPYYPCAGLALYNVQNGVIHNNTASYNYNDGIFVRECDKNNISNNTVSNNDDGLYFYYSDENTITSNTVSDNYYGIRLGQSRGNNLSSNLMTENGIFIGGFNLVHWNTHSIDTSNKVNGKSVYYWKNRTGGLVPLEAGQVILANCTDVVVSNQNVSNATVGIELGFSSYNTIDNNVVFSNNEYGIFLHRSSNNTIVNNSECDSNTGIEIQTFSDGNLVRNNSASENLWGGIHVDSSNNMIINNTANSNGWHGIYLYWGSDSVIRKNTASSNGMNGIFLSHSDDNIIDFNNVTNNDYGIHLSDSHRNIIANSSISSNFVYGISLESSGLNKVYHNNIIGNANQAYYDGTTSQFDNGYPSGGNCWSDYNGVDFNSTPTQDVPPPDGIGDTPYTNIGGGSGAQDNYPLMYPFGTNIFQQSLNEGWNLISVPHVQVDTAIEEVLRDIDGKWNYIQWYDPLDIDHWKTYATFKPGSLNDLFEINRTMAIWINITEPNVNITVRGLIPTSTSIPLYAGWNLVGYPTLNDTMTVANALWGTGADRVEKFDAMAPYRISEVGPEYVMKPGEGYWVHVPADSVWVIDW